VLLLRWLPVVEPVLRRAIYTARLVSLRAPAHLVCPIDTSRRGTVRYSWLAARQGGRRHEGIDIFAPHGTPVRATTEGVVARIGKNRLGGMVVWVIGPGGQRHYYAHLSRYADLRRGQRIAAGTVIGYVGNTGNARGTPPHLHYGIYIAEGAINPYPLLQKQAFPDGRER
jgi:murein DD-endopeptidase MepM/ murein hydrolase activator NlpD